MAMRRLRGRAGAWGGVGWVRVGVPALFVTGTCKDVRCDVSMPRPEGTPLPIGFGAGLAGGGMPGAGGAAAGTPPEHYVEYLTDDDEDDEEKDGTEVDAE
jgi:hypothetical protein